MIDNNWLFEDSLNIKITSLILTYFVESFLTISKLISTHSFFFLEVNVFKLP